MKFNEEAIKNNIIVPLLNEIGFDATELEFEKNFSIQLGRGVYDIKNHQTNYAAGRLDILCKQGERNIVLIELKAEGIDLTDSDRKQGLSYARLLDPIAPYVLLSNGTDSKIFESWTGKEVNGFKKNHLNQDFAFDIEEEIRLKYEALKAFIGYSKFNLFSFCAAINEKSLGRFKANATQDITLQIEKKYIPSLYVNRYGLENSFTQFLNQTDKHFFPIIGESGVGKTNLICYLVDKYSHDYPILFYSGSIIGKSLFAEFLFDFNMTFSAEKTEVGLLKKISALTPSMENSFLIVIDAIDEWIAEDKVYQLNQITKYFSQSGIKLVVSCKRMIWDDFLLIKGIQSEIALNLYPGVPFLEDFDNVESKKAVQQYTSFLKLKGSKNKLSQEFRNPFSLRVACEVAFHGDYPLKLIRNSRITIAKYIDLKFEKFSDAKLSQRYLVKVAKSLLQSGKAQISEERLRSEASMKIEDEITDDLFSFNFLYQYVDENGNNHIGFYYSTIRDYILAIRVLCLNSIPSEKRVDKIRQALTNFIGEYAIIYFFRTGNRQEQIDIIRALIRHDEEMGTGVLPRLISWQGNHLKESVKGQTWKAIIKHLFFAFEANRQSEAVAHQIFDSVEEFKKRIDIESTLLKLFQIMVKYDDESFHRISHRIANKLQNLNNPENNKGIDQVSDDHSL